MSKLFISKLHYANLGLEFWLPLPLVAGGFWLISSWFSQQAISQTAEPPTSLMTQTPQQISLSLSLTITSIDAEIDQDQGSTEVSVQTTGSALQELEFEYPLVEFADIEAAIAQEFNLSPQVIRNIIRYRIDY